MRSRTLAVAGLIAVAAATVGLRALGLHEGIWVDESLSIELASRPELAGLRSSDTPPLYYLLLRGWMEFGASDPWLRALSIAIALLTVVVFARWLWRTSPMAAIVGASLFAVWPLLLRYGREIRGYGLLLLLTVVAFDASDRLGSPSARRYVAWVGGAALMFAVATHLVAIFLVGAILAYALLGVAAERRRACLSSWLVPLVGPPVAAFAFFYFGFLEQVDKSGSWWVPSPGVEGLARIFGRVLGVYALGDWLEGLGAPHSAATFAAWGSVMALSVALARVGCAAGRRALVAAVLYWAQLLAYSLVAEPIVLSRTCLPGLVPWIAFLARQAPAARGRSRLVSLGLLAVVELGFAWDWVAEQAWIPHEPWKEVAASIEASADGNGLVQVYPAYATGALARYLPAARSVQPVASLRLPVVEGVTDLFLVVRLDANTTRQLEDLDGYARALARAVGPTAGEERLRNLVVTRFRRPPPADR